jgi:predicted acetyltransferase
MSKNITIIPAVIADYPTIQNMARFYVYDRTVYMGWECPEDGMFECIDFKHYFEDSDKKAFLVKIENELAGFVLLDQEGLIETVDWNIGEFFILAKFQGKDIALKVIESIFKMHPGKWCVAVMPENIKALKFWRKAIILASGNKFTEIFKTEKELKTVKNPDPYAMNIFSFKTQGLNKPLKINA